MEANNIIKEEDEGDSDATSMRGAGKGKSTEVIESSIVMNMANSSTRAGTKYPTRETTPDVAAPQVAGPIKDKASNHSLPKHPTRQQVSK